MVHQADSPQQGVFPAGAEFIRNLGAPLRKTMRGQSRLDAFRAKLEQGLPSQNVSISLNSKEFADRIVFKTITTTESFQTHSEISDMVLELVGNGDWTLLGEMLEEWDQKRACCCNNRRLMQTVMSEVILKLLTVSVQSQPIRDDEGVRFADVSIAHLERAVEAQPHLYPLAAIAAQMRLAQAWEIRGAAPRAPSLAARTRLNKTLGKARDLLDRLDSKSLNSPLVAMIQFNLLPFLPEGSKAMMETYKDWVCLDPGDLTPHRRMGQLLLPKWHGDYETLERTALEAVAWTDHETGAAAYAVTYMSAMSHDRTPLAYLDGDLMEDALEDLIVFRQRDPTHLPDLVSRLWRASQWRPELGLDPEARTLWAGQTTEMGRLALRCLARHLTAIHEKSWAGGAREALEYISLAAQNTLASGGRLKVDDRGITCQM